MDRENLIREHMSLAARMARKMAPRYLRDDLVAESYLILCQAIDRKPHLHGTELRMYLCGAVRKGILYAIRRDHPMEPLPPVVVPANYTTDLRDLLQACCRRPIETQIIELRLQHYSWGDIAATIGWTYKRVHLAVKRIQKRWSYRS
jgi:DNA-directed RNA polymerase specialized sigma subunit